MPKGQVKITLEVPVTTVEEATMFAEFTRAWFKSVPPVNGNIGVVYQPDVKFKPTNDPRWNDPWTVKNIAVE